jgi:hypothetical protein
LDKRELRQSESETANDLCRQDHAVFKNVPRSMEKEQEHIERRAFLLIFQIALFFRGVQQAGFVL